MKIVWIFLFAITSIFANEYYAKLEPIDSFQVKSAVQHFVEGPILGRPTE